MYFLDCVEANSADRVKSNEKDIILVTADSFFAQGILHEYSESSDVLAAIKN